MKKLLLILLCFSFFFKSCSDKEKEAELEAKIKELSIQLDECQNGSDKLLAAIQIENKNKNNSKVKLLFKEIESRHPESKEYTKAKKIYDKIIAEEKEKEEYERNLKELEEKERLKSLNKLKKTYDDVSGVTWYYNPYFTHYDNKNLTSVYIGQQGKSTWLILKMSYSGDDWIFFDNAILSYEGKTRNITFDKYNDYKSDNSGGGVWEWIQVSVDYSLEEYLRRFAKSKNAKMRLSGKYSETRTLTYNERKGILDVLNGYDVLKQQVTF